VILREVGSSSYKYMICVRMAKRNKIKIQSSVAKLEINDELDIVSTMIAPTTASLQESLQDSESRARCCSPHSEHVPCFRRLAQGSEHDPKFQLWQMTDALLEGVGPG